MHGEIHGSCHNKGTQGLALKVPALPWLLYNSLTVLVGVFDMSIQ